MQKQILQTIQQYASNFIFVSLRKFFEYVQQNVIQRWALSKGSLEPKDFCMTRKTLGIRTKRFSSSISATISADDMEFLVSNPLNLVSDCIFLKWVYVRINKVIPAGNIQNDQLL